jgi:four helix bundle protein
MLVNFDPRLVIRDPRLETFIMPKIERFEDLEAWKKSREMTKAVYRVTSTRNFSRDLSLKGQVRGSAVSSMSNIAEGFERGGDRQFLQFLAMAKGSTGEVRSQLYVALDAGYLSQSEFDEIFTLAAETSRLVGGLMRYLKTAEPSGPKSPKSQGRSLKDKKDL